MINRLQEIRWKRELSQEELAATSGVSRSTIQKIENNQTNMIRRDILYKLSIALNVEPYKIYIDREEVLKPCEDNLEGCLYVYAQLRQHKLLCCSNNDEKNCIYEYKGYYYAYSQAEYSLKKIIDATKRERKKVSQKLLE